MQSICATAQRREINQYKAARMAAGMTQPKASLALFIMKGGGHSMLVTLLGIGIAILLLQVATAAVAEIRFRDVRQIMLGKDDANETDQDPR